MVSWLFGGSSSGDRVIDPAPPEQNLRVQTSVQGAPRSIGWGQCRLAGNLLWYGDFQAIAHTQTQGGGGGGGGKGGGGGGGGTVTTTTYTYQAAVIFALCEGPVAQFVNVWDQKGLQSFGAYNFTTFLGAYNQAAWSYMTSLHPSEALNYRGLALACAGPLPMGDSSSLPNLNFEILFSVNSGIAGLPDADPKAMIEDFLTNAHYGLLFPAQFLDTWNDYSQYCKATSMVMSVALSQQQSANNVLHEIMNATNSELVWSGRLLRIVPYGDAGPVTANGATYTPPSVPLFSLGDDSFMANSGTTSIGQSSYSGDDPVVCVRKRKADMWNAIAVEYLDRNNQYNPTIAEAKDDASIAIYGLRKADNKTFHFFCNGAGARMSAQLQLSRQQVLNQYAFTVDQRYIWLDPMDLIEVTEASLGLVNHPVLIKEITENQDGSLTMVVEDYLNPTSTVPAHGTQATLGNSTDFNKPAGNVNPPIVFEPPSQLIGNNLEVWIGVSGQPGVYGGCQIWLSTDDVTYAYEGQITGAARTGVLLAGLNPFPTSPIPPTIDQVNTLEVDLTESGGQLLSGTQSDALSNVTLCYVDNELVSYQTATLVSGNIYDMTYLVRGCYGSQISAHPQGGKFCRLDNNILKITYPPLLIGKTIYIKVLSFNIYGGGLQSLAEVQAYSYTINGGYLTNVLPDIQGLTTVYQGGILMMVWSPVSDTRSPIDYEIRFGNTWSTAQYVGRTPLTQAPASYGDGVYWISAHYRTPSGRDVYSANPISIIITGSQLRANTIVTFHEAPLWEGIFNNTFASGGVLYLQSGVNSGTYEIPVGHQVNMGRVATVSIIVKLGKILGLGGGVANILTLDDVLTMPDVFGLAYNEINVLIVEDILLIDDVLGQLAQKTVSAQPQVRVSQDGALWGPWKNWYPGIYTGMVFSVRVVLATEDLDLIAVLSDMEIGIDATLVIQQGTNVEVPAEGLVIYYPEPFSQVQYSNPNPSPIPSPEEPPPPPQDEQGLGAVPTPFNADNPAPRYVQSYDGAPSQYADDQAAVGTLPAAVDLRSTGFLPSVVNQGTYQTCVACSTATCFQYMVRKQSLTDFTPSRMFIFYQQRKMEGNFNDPTNVNTLGTYPADAFSVLQQLGVPAEVNWPYDLAHFTEPGTSIYQEALGHKLTEFYVFQYSLQQYKTCLAAGYPFVFAFYIYQSFYDSSNTGVINLPTANDTKRGGHMMVAVGYDDSTQRFIFQNSWGTTFGQNGFGTIPYAYLTDSSLAYDIWTIRTVTG